MTEAFVPPMRSIITYTWAPGGTLIWYDGESEVANYCTVGGQIHPTYPSETYSCTTCQAPWKRYPSHVVSTCRMGDSAEIQLADGTVHRLSGEALDWVRGARERR